MKNATAACTVPGSYPCGPLSPARNPLQEKDFLAPSALQKTLFATPTKDGFSLSGNNLTESYPTPRATYNQVIPPLEDFSDR
jgi:hypothetical protein